MPSGAPVRPLPVGFFLSGLASLFFSGVVGMVLLVTELQGGADGSSVLARGAMVLLLSLGIITTEALWNGSPSAYPASVALAASYAATVLIGLAANPHDPWPYVVMLVVSACVVGPILGYLRARSRQFWPRPGVRVPAPRP